MSETIERAERTIQRELKHAEQTVTKLRKALAAMQAISGKGTGQRARSKGELKPCGCGTMYRAYRSDARYCSACRVKRKQEWNEQKKKQRAVKSKGPKPRRKGTLLAKNTPTAKK